MDNHSFVHRVDCVCRLRLVRSDIRYFLLRADYPRLALCAHAHRRPAADEQARLDHVGRGVRRAVAKLHCRRDLDSDAALYLIF